MLARHKIPLILLTVGVSTLSMTGAAFAGGNDSGTTTTSNTCATGTTPTNGTCVTAGSSSGAIALNQKIGVGGTGTGRGGGGGGGGGGHYTPPPATPLCGDQWINNGIDHPIWTPYKSGKVTVNGTSYAWVQVRCSL